MWEASAAKSPFIEKEHAVIGLLSLEKVAAGKPDDMKLNREQWNNVRAEWAAHPPVMWIMMSPRELRRVVERELEMNLAEKILKSITVSRQTWKVIVSDRVIEISGRNVKCDSVLI